MHLMKLPLGQCTGRMLVLPVSFLHIENNILTCCSLITTNNLHIVLNIVVSTHLGTQILLDCVIVTTLHLWKNIIMSELFRIKSISSLSCYKQIEVIYQLCSCFFVPRNCLLPHHFSELTAHLSF